MLWVGVTDDEMKRLQLGNSVPSAAFIDANGIVRARILGQLRPARLKSASIGCCAIVRAALTGGGYAP